jgi:hypothetical protein
MRFRKDMKTGAGLVRLADGSLLSEADLPPRDTTRWVASCKLAVVRAVLYQLRTQEEVLETYSISDAVCEISTLTEKCRRPYA